MRTTMKRFIGFIVLFLGLMATAVTPAHAADFTVCASGCDHTTIAAAITAATSGDTITIMDDVHTEQGIVVNKNLTIQGQGAINTIVQANANPASATDRVFTITNNAIVTLTNMTIQNGNTISISSDGGGIYNHGGSILTVSYSTLRNNDSGLRNGGAIYNEGTVNVRYSTIINNEATYGGGIASRASGTSGSTLNIYHSTLQNNVANIGGGISNAGSFDYQSFITIINSTLSNNRGRGGGLFNDLQSVATITNSTITGNTTAASSDSGGGILNNNASTVTLIRTIVAGNSAGNSGDEIYNAIGGSVVTADEDNVLGHSGLTNAEAFSGFIPGGSDVNATSDNSNILLSNILVTVIADNGGPTLTHAIPTGSPALDIAPAGSCNGTPLNGLDQRGAARSYGGGCDAGAVEARLLSENCALSTGSDTTIGDLTFNITTMGTLDCLKVEAMGNVNHPQATAPIETGRWWHVYGEDSGGNRVTGGFDLAISLPFASANSTTRACKFPGDLGGFGWDCDDDDNGDGIITTFVANTSVTRTSVDSFSDWAVGQGAGPTAVSLQSLSAHSPIALPVLVLLLLVMIGITAVFYRRAAR